MNCDAFRKGGSFVDTILQISFFSLLVFSGLTVLAGAFVYAGHLLAVEAVEEYEPHEH